MKMLINKAKVRTIGAAIASLTLLMSFQNCGKAGFDGSTDDLSSSGDDASLTAKYGDTAATKVTSIPFSFDATFDQIAYNSCARTGLQTSKGYFSISAGAYGDFGGGVRIKDSFFDYADANFKPIFPETTLTENQYREYLADSPENKGAQPMMAIRTSNSLTDIHGPSNNTPTLGSEVINMAGVLTDSLLMVSLSQKGTIASYLPFSGEQKVLEAKLTFNSSEDLAQGFRDDLMGAGVLAITYSKTGGQVSDVRAPAAYSTYPIKKAYGRSFKLGFGNVGAPASPTSLASNPNNILTDVWESDLENPAAGNQWNCDYNRRYLILRNQDAAACPQEDASALTTAANRKELQIVRRHLRADQWDVNVTLKCAVPKTGTSLACYTEESIAGAPVGANYLRDKECFQSNKDTSSYTGTTIPKIRCAQFLSICTRY